MKEQLQRIWVECPSRPKCLDDGTHATDGCRLPHHYIDTLERLVATLAEDVARLRGLVPSPKVVGPDACPTCDGWGSYEMLDTQDDSQEEFDNECERCSGTGRRQA